MLLLVMIELASLAVYHTSVFIFHPQGGAFEQQSAPLLTDDAAALGPFDQAELITTTWLPLMLSLLQQPVWTQSDCEHIYQLSRSIS